MDRPGSEAVGIGADADVKKFRVICQRRALETDFGGVTCSTPRCYDNSRDDSGAVHFYVHPRSPVTLSAMDVKDRSSP